MIRPPRSSLPPQDRFLDCQEALETHFLALIELAAEAGWQHDEAAAAVTSLSDNFLLGRLANTETGR